MSIVQTRTIANGQAARSGAISSEARVNQRSAAAPSPRHRIAAPMDMQIIERLKIGDSAALETVFNLYAAKLYRVAQRILGDAADSEEVIQDVFWTVYRKANTFKGESKFSTWLYRLTVNAALSRMRKRKQQSAIEYRAYLPKFQSDGHHRARPVIDWSDTLDEKYAEHEIAALVGNALEQLKPTDKSIVVLSDMEGFSDRETAAVLQLTVSAVKARLHRARLFLRGKLAAQLGAIPAVSISSNSA